MKEVDLLTIFDQPAYNPDSRPTCPVHIILAWNPDDAFGKGASRGVQLWTDVLKRISKKGKSGDDELYTWWGKISITGRLGMEKPSEWISKFNEQIDRLDPDQETHLYMYCGYFYDERPGILHVAKVIKVAGHHEVDLDDPEVRKHVPIKFYQSVRNKNRENKHRYKSGHLIPYWFKISDIREIRKYHLQNLLRLNTNPHSEEAPVLRPFSPVRFDSPLPVLEHGTRQFFDSEDLKAFGLKGWWQETARQSILIKDDFPKSPYEKQEITKWKGLSVKRTPGKMAETVATLLKLSQEIVFVDPWFSTYEEHWNSKTSRQVVEPSRWLGPLSEFLKEAAAGRKLPLSRLEYHSRFNDDMDYEKFREYGGRFLEPIIPCGWEMKLFAWKQKKQGQPFHARFILTERAGVLFEHGLDTGPGEGLVVLLTPHIHQLRWESLENPAQYFDGSGIEPVIIKGKKEIMDSLSISASEQVP